MCKWGTDRTIFVIHRKRGAGSLDGWHPVDVDACIADYVQQMNERGIITVNCCCGHGNGSASVLVSTESVDLLTQWGYEHHTFDNRVDVVEHFIPTLCR